MLNEILSKFHDGHTYVLSPGHYRNLLGPWGFKPYEDMLKESESSYKMWEKIFKNAHREGELENYYSLMKPKENVTTDVIEPGKIAYLKVHSFLLDYHNEGEEYKREREMIYDFLRSIKDYPYLVIDISDNGGGNRGYWLEAIIAPLKNKLKEVKNLSVEKTYLIRAFL